MTEPFVGQLELYGFNFVPEDWLPCSGALVAVNDHQALFALLGTTYGGDGRTQFGLPDLRGRVAVSQGDNPYSGTNWRMGQQAGAEKHQLTVAELPTHGHPAQFTPGGGSQVTMAASTDQATSASPVAGGYLAASVDGSTRFAPDGAGAKALLGGATGGSGKIQGQVALDSTGHGGSFSLLQSSLSMNYCIAWQGYFPSRS